MTVHDEAELLESHLPIFLTQQCTSNYEVIVVDDASTDDTPDVLMRLKAQYPLLYTTFIPKSVPNPCRQRLALTIGAKAAHSDWVVLADIKRPPRSETCYENLLQTVADEQAGAVTSYHGRKENSTTRYLTWDDLEAVNPLIRKAERRSGRGHRGRCFKVCRGLYDMVAIPRNNIFDALKFYDQQVRGRRLLGLRLHVLWTSLLKHTIKHE